MAPRTRSAPASEQATPVRYAPSSAPLPASDDSQVEGHFATFTLGYVAFQVFTVDYVAAGRHQASAWNDHVPTSLAQALPRIWPPLLVQPEVSWPPQAFGAPAWDRLVTWDRALRREPTLASLGSRRPTGAVAAWVRNALSPRYVKPGAFRLVTVLCRGGGPVGADAAARPGVRATDGSGSV